MLRRIALMSFAAVTLVACGNNHKTDSTEAPQAEATPETATETTTEAVAEDIPQSVVIRVPVDENDEAIGAPELKSLTGDINLEDDAAVEEAFAAAEAEGVLASSEDELDADSSTQSWYCNRGFRGFLGYRGVYRGGYRHFNRGYFGSGFGLRLGYRGKRISYSYHRGFGVGNGSFRNGIRTRYRYYSYRAGGRW